MVEFSTIGGKRVVDGIGVGVVLGGEVFFWLGSVGVVFFSLRVVKVDSREFFVWGMIYWIY